MLSPLSSTTIRAMLAIFFAIVHLTNAAGGPPGGMRAQSSNSGDDATSIISMIDPNDKKDVLSNF